MKLSLVVAQGVHAGKVIPIASSQFLIGRDPHCNLRPQSQAVSKQHAGLFVRDGKIFLKDYGSTNGSFVNGEPVADEREIKHDDQLKIGPLEFVLRVEISTSTPTPTATAKPPAVKPAAAAKPVAAKPAIFVPPPAPAPVAPVSPMAAQSAEDQSDQLAAMLLMDEVVSESSERTAEQGIPDGTTVMEIPAVPDDPAKAADLLQKVKEQSKNNSTTAGDLLKKYMNRPRT